MMDEKIAKLKFYSICIVLSDYKMYQKLFLTKKMYKKKSDLNVDKIHYEILPMQ